MRPTAPFPYDLPTEASPSADSRGDPTMPTALHLAPLTAPAWVSATREGERTRRPHPPASDLTPAERRSVAVDDLPPMKERAR